MAEVWLFFQELQILIELEKTLFENTDELTKVVILILIAWFNLWQKNKTAKKKNSALEKKNAELEKRVSKLENKPHDASKGS